MTSVGLPFAKLERKLAIKENNYVLELIIQPRESDEQVTSEMYIEQ